MGLLDRFESGTERVFTAPFARLFKREELQPVEIGAAIRKAMDSRAAVVNRHRTIVPNVFTIELSDDDFDRLIAFDEAITDELIADAQEYVTEQRYTPGGPLQIELVADPDLQPGIYKLHHATVRNPATLDERGDIDSWGAAHERFDDAIDRHTQGHRIPADAKYLGEVDEEAIAAAKASSEQPTADDSAARGAEDARRARKEADRAAEARRDREREAAAEQHRAEIRRAAEREQAQRERGGQEETEQETRDTAATTQVPARSTRSVARPWVEVDGVRHVLEKPTTLLGRDTVCDITVPDPGISRRHVELTVDAADPARLSLRDLGSTNGTFVGGERIHHTRLADGDSFVMGRTTVTVRLGRAQ